MKIKKPTQISHIFCCTGGLRLITTIIISVNNYQSIKKKGKIFVGQQTSWFRAKSDRNHNN